MKEFVVYTGLRVVLFLASWAIVSALWVLVSGSASLGITALIAFLLSGVGSYFVLQAPRNRFATVVAGRADKAVARFEASRSKEDVD